MTRTEAIKEFFKKAVLPVAIAGLLYCIFKSACIRNGELDLLWLWILCGLPFGIHRMCVWIVPGGGSLGGGAALFVLNFIIGGLIGGFVLVWRLLVAAWYVPLTIYRLIVGYCDGQMIESRLALTSRLSSWVKVVSSSDKISSTRPSHGAKSLRVMPK